VIHIIYYHNLHCKHVANGPNSLDQGILVNVTDIILDFQKAFDSVPHKDYCIRLRYQLDGFMVFSYLTGSN